MIDKLLVRLYEWVFGPLPEPEYYWYVSYTCNNCATRWDEYHSTINERRGFSTSLPEMCMCGLGEKPKWRKLYTTGIMPMIAA